MQTALRHPSTLWWAPLALGLACLGCDDGSSSDALDQGASPQDAAMGAGGAGGAGGFGGMGGMGGAGGMGGQPAPDASPGADAGPPPRDAGPDPWSICDDQLIPPTDWPEGADGVLAGQVELGQTHVVPLEGDELAPRPIAERATLVLFEPETPLPEGAEVHLRAVRAGEPLGVLPMTAGSPALLESGLTETPLAPYNPAAWSAQLPWDWVIEGVEVEIAAGAGEMRQVHRFTLEDLQSPHHFTLTRTHMVLFGEPGFEAITQPSSRVLRDYFPVTPVAQMRWVDTLPWRVNEIVVRTDNGPRLASAEADRLAITNQDHHWFILKNQFTLRLSLANTGRGLALTEPSQGDNSPYSLGTSVGMGWFRDPEGRYRDIDDAPWAAGWTGWTAMWVEECGNGFIHEVGHSFTLAHFTEGTAEQWGIAEVYPLDGVNIAEHPWGYDSVRRRLRTWYRVDANGPVMEGGQPVGKRDPMNGGESPNAQTCFPQYTAYHARRAQDWMNQRPTLLDRDGGPGVFNFLSGRFVPTSPQDNGQWPIALETPTVTLIGTLGARAEIQQIYPPILGPSGHVFEWPDPFGDELPDVYDGARYFLEIEYAEGGPDYALIASGLVAEPDLRIFSLNLEADRRPVRAHLWRAPMGYPMIALEASERIFTREIGAIPETMPPVLAMGQGATARGPLKLTARCTEGLDCDRRSASATWLTEEPVYVAEGEPTWCGDQGDSTTLSIEVEGPEGSRPLVIHAQRVVRRGALERRGPLTDATPWLQGPEVEQSIEIWLPFGPNAELLPGRYQGVSELIVEGAADERLPVVVDFTVRPSTQVSLVGEWQSPPVETPASSIYFLAVDPAVGPTSRVWWGEAQATPLTVPVINEAGEVQTLRVQAFNEICGGERIEMHAGRVANDCPHRLILQASLAQNGALAGGLWRTPPSAPLIIEARRWHDPDGQALLETFVLDLEVDLR